jgi:hypothetical protein
MTANTTPVPSKYTTKPDACVMCERKVSLTFHHLIPRKMHRRTFFRKNYTRSDLAAGIWICRKCHSGLHRLYDEMTLAKHFFTLELVKADPAIQKHIGWVAKQKA